MDVENKSYTEAQMAFVKQTAAQCREHDILLLIEELTFPRQERRKPCVSRSENQKHHGLHQAVERLRGYPEIGVPGESNLAALTELSAKPWVLLSASEKYDIFVKQVEQSMKAGASGIMAGRAIFNEYFEQVTPQAQEQFLRGTAVARMKELGQLVDKHGASWLETAGLTWNQLAQSVHPKWYADVKGTTPAASATTAITR